jgi:hypothetical protein
MASVKQSVRQQSSHRRYETRAERCERQLYRRRDLFQRNDDFQIDDAFRFSRGDQAVIGDSNNASQLFDLPNSRAKYLLRLTSIDQANRISIRHVRGLPAGRECHIDQACKSSNLTPRLCDNLADFLFGKLWNPAIYVRHANLPQRMLQSRHANSESRAVRPSRPARVAEILEPQTPWMSPRVLHSSSRGSTEGRAGRSANGEAESGAIVLPRQFEASLLKAGVESGPRDSIQSRAAA